MYKVYAVIFLMVLALPATAGETSAVHVMQALRERMEVERSREAELQFLQLEVERLKLEVEKKKALVELGKIGAGGAEAVPATALNAPTLPRLRYVFMGHGRKEAVFDADGVEYRVQEGGEVAGRQVKAVSADGAVLKDKDGVEQLFRPGI